MIRAAISHDDDSQGEVRKTQYEPPTSDGMMS